MSGVRTGGRLNRRSLSIAVTGAIAGLMATAAMAEGAIVYDNIPSPTPGNVASLGEEATQGDEYGGQIGLAGAQRLSPQVTALMSSWGCESGTWNGGDCATTLGSTFSHPITLNLYNVGPGNSVGSLIASKTQTFSIPYRPSADNTNCTGANAGKWFSVADAACYNGFATPITFDLPTAALPNNVIASIAYNTSNSGNAPLGPQACVIEPGGCGYDALNVGAETFAPSVGTHPAPNDAYWDTATAGNYCDGGAGGTDTFRLDAGCNADFQPSFRVDAASAFVVNDNTTGPGPAGADCANPDFNTIQGAVAAAPAGATILVCAGNYPEAVSVTKPLTLRGAQSGVDARTRAVPAASESVVTSGAANTFSLTGLSASESVVIDGFTINHTAGAGIFSQSGSNHVYRDNVISGDIYAVNTNVPGTTVFENRIENSSIGFEANSAPKIDDTTISSNRFVNVSNYAIHLISGGAAPHTGLVVKNNQKSGLTGGNFLVLHNTEGARVSGNTITGGGSTLFFGGSNEETLVEDNRITGATSAVRLTTAFTPGEPNDEVNVVRNVLNGNARGVNADSGAITSRFELHGNSIAGNTTAGVESAGPVPVDAIENWWGCNAGPGQPGCDALVGAVDASPWLVLGASASPSTVYAVNGKSEITASLARNSAGEVAASGFPDNVSIAFTVGPLGSVSPASDLTDASEAQTQFSAGAATGSTSVTATLDGEPAVAPLTIVAAPQGPTGPPGPAGPQGNNGQDGANGVAGVVGGSKKCKKKGKGKKAAASAKKCKRKKK